MGAYLQITPALRTRLGYGEVRGCYLGPLGKVDHKRAVSLEGEEFTCEIDLFNAEKDRFPYPDEHFATVLCCELIEHLEQDPMFLMSEVNRILKPGGHLVMTTPNIASLRAIKAILMGYHPGFFPAYLKPSPNGSDEARHAREYTPQEIMMLFLDAGFEMTLLDTGPFRDLPRPEEHWIRHLLDRYLLSSQYRGDGIYAVGRKAGPVKERYPSWLYQ
jgi:SAM-dependent methyltransferase